MRENWKTRKQICSVCGNEYTQRYVPYINLWCGECDCVINQRRADEQEWHEAQRQRKIERNIRNSNIPRLYTESTFEKFEMRPELKRAFDISKKYAELFPKLKENGKGILFIGNTGSGKTHLAIAIAHEVLKQGYIVKFASLTNVIAQANCAGDYGKTEAETIMSLSKCSLLILDDICVTNVGDRWKRVLFTIIDNRVNDVKPTIFTSNISNAEEIKTLLNEQIYDRITGSCTTINVTAESYRRKKR